MASRAVSTWPGIPEAGFHPFYDEAPFELGDGAEDGEHHLSAADARIRRDKEDLARPPVGLERWK